MSYFRCRVCKRRFKHPYGTEGSIKCTCGSNKLETITKAQYQMATGEVKRKPTYIQCIVCKKTMRCTEAPNINKEWKCPFCGHHSYQKSTRNEHKQRLGITKKKQEGRQMNLGELS